MPEALTRPAGSYRERTLVLCIFKYLTRDERGSGWRPDALMLKVEFSDQIEPAFWKAIEALKQKPFAPRMHEIEFVRYMTSNGLEKF